jgi:hypothetical protein
MRRGDSSGQSRLSDSITRQMVFFKDIAEKLEETEGPFCRARAGYGSRRVPTIADGKGSTSPDTPLLWAPIDHL